MKSADATLVLVISSNLSFTHEIETAIQGEEDFLAISSAYSPTKIFEDLNATRPNIVVLDIQFDHAVNVALIDEITSRYPGTAVVALLPENQVHLAEKVILAGARAFVIAPVSPVSLITTLRRVRDIQARTAVAQPVAAPVETIPPSRRRYVVFSPKGGVGCTTLAVNLAIALRHQLKEEILLLDGKHILGHVALMLNIRTANSITDLLSNVNQLDQSLVKQVVVEHVSGISVLPSPSSILSGQGIKPDELFKVLQVLTTVYQNIVIDGGNFLDDNLVTYMDTASQVLLVVNPNLASIRDARQFLDLSSHLSYSKDKILVVVNQLGRKADVKLNEIEQVLRTKVLGSIPVDEDMALNSLNDGVPVIQKKSNHAISKAVNSLAKLLINLSAASSADTQARGAGDMLKKSSFLG